AKAHLGSYLRSFTFICGFSRLSRGPGGGRSADFESKVPQQICPHNTSLLGIPLPFGRDAGKLRRNQTRWPNPEHSPNRGRPSPGCSRRSEFSAPRCSWRAESLARGFFG